MSRIFKWRTKKTDRVHDKNISGGANIVQTQEEHDEEYDNNDATSFVV